MCGSGSGRSTTCRNDQSWFLELQIALSEVHSSGVNSGGPLGGRSSSLMRFRRSSVSGWFDRMDRLLSTCFPVTRYMSSPIGFGDRPSLCITSIANVSALYSASREYDNVTSEREAKINAPEP